MVKFGAFNWLGSDRLGATVTGDCAPDALMMPRWFKCRSDRIPVCPTSSRGGSVAFKLKLSMDSIMRFPLRSAANQFAIATGSLATSSQWLTQRWPNDLADLRQYALNMNGFVKIRTRSVISKDSFDAVRVQVRLKSKRLSILRAHWELADQTNVILTIWVFPERRRRSLVDSLWIFTHLYLCRRTAAVRCSESLMTEPITRMPPPFDKRHYSESVSRQHLTVNHQFNFNLFTILFIVSLVSPILNFSSPE